MTGPSYRLSPCAVCSSSAADELVSLDESKEELEELWEYHQKRLRPDTPPVHLIDRVAFSQRAPLRLVRCHECGLVYRNPVERPAEVAEIYEDEGLEESVLRALHDDAMTDR